MAKIGGSDEDMIVDINMTPFVDIVLVLLIIFMVTAKLMFSSSIPLELPKASTGADPKSSPLAISIKPKQGKDKEEQLFLNGKPMTLAELKLGIAALVQQKGKKVQAIIAADHRVTHGRVIIILDLLRQLGVEEYAFNIDPQTPQP